MIITGPIWTQNFESYAPIAKPDAKGKWAYGFGHDIEPPDDADHPPTCTRDQAVALFSQDYFGTAVSACRGLLGDTWTALDDIRRAVLLDLAYEMGGAGLAEFHMMLAAIKLADWAQAALDLLNSEYAEEVPRRANANAAVLASGQWPGVLP